MYPKSPLNSMSKRSHDSTLESPRKRPCGAVKLEDNVSVERKNYMFRILLPNGTTLEIRICEPQNEMPIETFIDIVRKEYSAVRKQETSQSKRRINWKYQDLHFTDASTSKIKVKVNFHEFKPNKWHFLWLHDGSPESDTYEDMWDLTPDTDLLKELPDDYTVETALADLIDNSLQALWLNDKRDRKLISVEVRKNKIIIFDSGPGMDGAAGNLVNWGKMGSSLHRTARGKSIGGEPPYLTPFFGMFGYGGPVATMCLGRSAIVSSKVKKCKKVYTLHLERDALISASCLENCWRTKGGTRDPSEDEKENSRHGSFMKVEIFEPRMKIEDIKHLQYKLKDIYFPYIQNDEPGKITMPIKFQVNCEDLVGIQGGEMAQTNLHSCNGPDFILQLHFRITKDQDPSLVGPSKRVILDANARLKFVYFPVVKGKESFNSIIDSLHADGYGNRETFESFSRVSIRRLGRLLPDACWASLPFMVAKPKKGERAKMLKMCYSRVKCFIDTDGGFNPTPHKTDLAHHHPYTVALKNFGDKTFKNDEGLQIEIFKDKKEMTLPPLEKLYNDWILEMHAKYDEIDGGVDQPTILVNPHCQKLDLSSDVLRIHKEIKRGGRSWTAGQKIKVLKGACAGCHNNNVYATLQYIIFEGLPGDAGGEVRLICSPLGLSEAHSCQILEKEGNTVMNIRDSLVLPIRIIDSEMCIPVDEMEWENKLSQKIPSTIALLSQSDYKKLGIEGGIPDGVVNAGDAFPACIVAVIRPKLFSSGKGFKSLDPKFIVKDKTEMILEVKFSAGGGNDKRHILSLREKPSLCNGINGFYLFQLKSLRAKTLNIYDKAGKYAFLFSLVNFKGVKHEKVLHVQASADSSRWEVIKNNHDSPCTVSTNQILPWNEILILEVGDPKNYLTRVCVNGKESSPLYRYSSTLNHANRHETTLKWVGTVFGPVSIKCCDRYGNHVKFTCVPELTANLRSSVSTALAQEYSVKGKLSTDKSAMVVEGIVIESSNLDCIRPSYEATLKISTLDEAFSVALCCKVLPGTPKWITAHPADINMKLIPGQIIDELALEIFDEFGNHAKEDETISLKVNGFLYQDRTCVLDGATCVKKVDRSGFVDISHLLKVSTGYGKAVSLSVTSHNCAIFRMDFKTLMRQLRTGSQVFKNCEAGSRLENVVFKVTDSQGAVDESVNHNERLGQSHTLTIKSDTLDIDDSVQYKFRDGCCTIRSIPLPHAKGVFSFTAAHSRYSELSLDIKVNVENDRASNQGNTREKNCGVAGHLVVSPRDLSEDFLLLPQTPVDILKPAYDFSSPVTAVENVLPAIHASSASNFRNSGTQNMRSDPLQIPSFGISDCDNSGTPTTNIEEELKDDLLACYSNMTDYKTKLESLESTLKTLEMTSVTSDPDLCAKSSMYCKQFVLEKIQSKSHSAGTFICKLQDQLPISSQHGSLLGIVALLAIVDNIDLSRLLAQYLGNDLMGAIVCKNYDAAKSLEVSVFNELSSERNDSTCGGYFAICLDCIRPCCEFSRNDPEAPLPLQPPTLPNGNRPKGFLGYAINMISIDETVSHWKTSSGHGLRETLFFSLFGELQVYDKRSRMMRAQSCIKDGAISLDGGMMKGNGLVSFGKWDPDIVFPVRQNQETTRFLEILKVKREMEDAQRTYNTLDMKYSETMKRYNSIRG